MAPHKILYCIESIGRGGTEKQLVGLINRLDRELFQPQLCTLRPSSDYLNEVACPCLELNVSRLLSPGGLASVRRLARHVSTEGVAVVHSFFQDPTLVALPAARLGRVPVRLNSFRDLGFWRTPLQVFLMRRAYPLATGFMANSQAVKHHVSRKDHLDPSRIKVVYNGVDTNEYRFVEHLESEVSIGIVGNLNRRVKRTDLFLRAAARVHARHPEVVFHVIGDGELRPEYETLAAGLGISRCTVFAGRIEDVPGYLGKLAVGVICSDSEGFSNAVLEYMLRGCAVIATSVGGNLEVIHDGETGLLIPPGNVVALASAMTRLVEEKKTRLMLTLRARAVAEESFDWSGCVAEHQDHYAQELRRAGVV
ncbi:glycosyltransferase [bacterium]|nr:glycosyltransferase [bacterium]